MTDAQDLSTFSWQMCDQWGIKSGIPAEAYGRVEIRRLLTSPLRFYHHFLF